MAVMVTRHLSVSFRASCADLIQPFLLAGADAVQIYSGEMAMINYGGVDGKWFIFCVENIEHTISI